MTFFSSYSSAVATISVLVSDSEFLQFHLLIRKISLLSLEHFGTSTHVVYCLSAGY